MLAALTVFCCYTDLVMGEVSGVDVHRVFGWQPEDPSDGNYVKEEKNTVKASPHRTIAIYILTPPTTAHMGHSNGIKKSEINYTKGIRNGKTNMYHPTGESAGYANYKDGLIFEGQQFYPNGQKVSDLTFGEDGFVQHGIYYFKTGEKRSEFASRRIACVLRKAFPLS